MRKLWLLVLALVLAMAPAAWAADELKLFQWSEYMDEENMPKEFTKKTGINVRLEVYENNEEMVAKLQAGGVSQYDIVVPSDYIMPILLHEKLVMPLDHAKIPNIKNLKPLFRNTTYDPGNKFSAAWQWGTVGLMYRKDKIKDADAASWDIIFDPKKNPGPFYLIDSPREMMGIALLYLGFDFNSTKPEELKKAADLLVQTKKRKECLGFKGGVGGKNDVVAGTANAAIVYNGDGFRGVAEDPKKMGFLVPKPGSEIWYDSMCIPAKAPNADAAHKWINYILEPEVGAQLSNFNRYATPNEASMPFITPGDLKENAIYPNPDVMNMLHFTKDLGNENKVMDAAWTRAKSQ